MTAPLTVSEVLDKAADLLTPPRDKWLIRIQGYGTFDFDGTEAEAEEMRRHKANWERGNGMKWCVSAPNEVDRITAEIAALWDSGRGAPQRLFTKRRKAAEAVALATQLARGAA